ncbi:unnamed protein product, partial [marine sediment metagenome]
NKNYILNKKYLEKYKKKLYKKVKTKINKHHL